VRDFTGSSACTYAQVLALTRKGGASAYRNAEDRTPAMSRMRTYTQWNRVGWVVTAEIRRTERKYHRHQGGSLLQVDAGCQYAGVCALSSERVSSWSDSSIWFFRDTWRAHAQPCCTYWSYPDCIRAVRMLRITESEQYATHRQGHSAASADPANRATGISTRPTGYLERKTTSTDTERLQQTRHRPTGTRRLQRTFSARTECPGRFQRTFSEFPLAHAVIDADSLNGLSGRFDLRHINTGTDENVAPSHRISIDTRDRITHRYRCDTTDLRNLTLNASQGYIICQRYR
jgi:hypothetical protein